MHLFNYSSFQFQRFIPMHYVNLRTKLEVVNLFQELVYFHEQDKVKQFTLVN